MDTFLSKLKQNHIQNITSLNVINDFEVSLHVKRDDLIDDVISGNKLFKLYYHLESFLKIIIKPSLLLVVPIAIICMQRRLLVSNWVLKP